MLDVNKIKLEELLNSKALIKKVMAIEKSKGKEMYINIMKIVKEEKDRNNINKIKRMLKYMFSNIIPEKEMSNIIKEIEKREENEEMSSINERLKEYFEEEKAKAKTEGEEAAKIKLIKNMKKKGIPIETIIEISNFSREEIEKIS